MNAMIGRRGFMVGGLSAIIATRCAPAFAGSGVLMPVRPVKPWWRTAGISVGFREDGVFSVSLVDHLIDDNCLIELPEWLLAKVQQQGHYKDPGGRVFSASSCRRFHPGLEGWVRSPSPKAQR